MKLFQIVSKNKNDHFILSHLLFNCIARKIAVRVWKRQELFLLFCYAALHKHSSSSSLSGHIRAVKEASYSFNLVSSLLVYYQRT